MANITFSFPAYAQHPKYTPIINLAQSPLDRGGLHALKYVYVVLLYLDGDGDNGVCAFWAVVASQATSGHSAIGNIFGNTGV